MLRNYLTIALRTLRRNFGYTAINLIGLAVGLAACILIGLYVRHELSYDDFHENAERIYRPVVKQKSFRGPARWKGWTAGTLAPQARSEMAGIADAVRLMQDGPTSIRHEDQVFENLQSHYTESNLFSIFSFGLLRGDPETVLSRPNTAVLTESLARRVYGSTDAVGKTLTVELRDSMRTVEVTGVSADVPSNSHVSYDLLFSFETLLNARLSITSEQFLTYILLQENHPSLSTLAERVVEHHEKSQPPVTAAQFQPLEAIYLDDVYAPTQGNRGYVLIFSAIAVLILLIACANYANLAIARSTQRIREIGVRKTVGGSQRQLVRQFLGEAVLISLLALPLALGAAYTLLPFFNRVAGTSIAPLQHLPASGWLVVVAATVGIGVLAGSYPAFYLSRFDPVQVLRKRHSFGGGTWLRKTLIVFQFALSAALIFSTGILLRQLQFVQEKNLGFDQEQVVTVPLKQSSVTKQARALKQEAARLPGIEHAALSIGAPVGGGFGTIGMGLDTETGKVSLQRGFVDESFLEALDISLLAGRNFTADHVAEGASVCLLNRTAVEALGWATPEQALGKEVGFSGRERVVIGVVEDFHFRPLDKPLEPLRLEPPETGGSLRRGTLLVRLEPGNVSETIDQLRSTWREFAAPIPFAFHFLDQQIEEHYRQEQRTATLFGSFAGLAILLACLGLLGLSAYAAKRREKEIGIRKTLGATASNIVALLSKEFLMLVAIACAIAVPIAYVGMEQWLQDFAYRVEVSPWLFVGASMLALTIAVATISVQALRAAHTDPAQTLRDE